MAANEYDLLLQDEEKRLQGNAAGNEYDGILAAEAKQDNSALRGNLVGAFNSDPDIYAQAKEIERHLGTPAPVVERNFAEAEKRLKLEQMDHMLRDKPVLAAKYRDPEFARLAHDRAETLAKISVDAALYGSVTEEKRTLLGGITEPFRRGLARARQGITVLASELGIYDGAQAELATRLVDQQRQVERYPVPPEVQKGLEQISQASTMYDALAAIGDNPRAVLETTIESLGASSPALLGAVGGSFAGPWGTAAGAGAGSFAVEYTSTLMDVIQERGGDPTNAYTLARAMNDPEVMAAAREKAVLRGIPVAAFDAATAGVAGRLLAGAKPTAASIGSRVAGEAGMQAAGGAAGEATAQSLTGEYKPGDILMEAAAEIPSGAVEVRANLRSARAAAQQSVVEETRRQAVEADTSLRAEQTITALVDQVQNEELLKRGAAGQQYLAEIINESAGEGEVYINARAAMQVFNQDPIQIATIPGAAEQIDDALAANGDIKVNVGDFVTAVAQNEALRPLIEHARTEASAMSPVEARLWQSTQGDKVMAEFERVKLDKEADTAWTDSAKQVEDFVFDQLQKAGRFTDSVNRADAKLHAAFAAVYAHELTKAGQAITPFEFFQQHTLRVISEDTQAGQRLDQKGNLRTDTPEFKAWFGDSKVVDAEGKPLVVYHGTGADFDAFKNSRSDVGMHFGTTGQANDRLDYMRERNRRPEEGMRTIPVYLSIKNPLRLRDLGAWDADTMEYALRDLFPADAARIKSLKTPKQIRDYLQSKGYDGIVYKNTGEVAGSASFRERIAAARDEMNKVFPKGKSSFSLEDQKVPEYRAWSQAQKDYEAFREANGEDSYIAFRPEQIKSVNNRGTWNPNDPNILNQSVERTPYGRVIVNPSSENLANLIDSSEERELRGLRVDGDLYVWDSVAAIHGQMQAELGLSGSNAQHVYFTKEGEQVRESSTASAVFNQSAFHGSPYRFDKFSLEHLGKGEGAQAFGWGLYFAGKKEVAEFYRSKLSEGQQDSTVMVNGQKVEQNTPEHHAARLLFYNDAREIKSSAKQWLKDAKAGEMWAKEVAQKSGLDAVAYYQRLSDFLSAHTRKQIQVAKGQLYEVSIPEDEDMLLWDKPITSQSQKVKDALKAAGLDKEFKANLSDFGSPQSSRGKGKGENFYSYLEWKLGSAEAASKRLNELGIAGIKYPAGTLSNGKAGGFNYVIFDDSAVQILQTYYQKEGQGSRGFFDPSQNLIGLLARADLSTFLHESGHYFLEVMGRVAMQPDAPPRIRSDFEAALKWMGVEPSPTLSRMDTWALMDLEQRRQHHEKFARGFEAYLFEGRAPSVELDGIFARFRAWLVRIYKSVKALNVEINDEVRGVFDRMLATEDQIREAEAARRFAPIFQTPEEAAAMGVDWEAYQRERQQATDEAVAEVQGKSLRDMKWLTGAKGRKLKELQKAAKDLRNLTMIDVRREVMTEPVYQAWQFLTGKMEKAKKAKAPKSDPNFIDPTRDSLMVAIAKAGGIDKAQMMAEWGIDPADIKTIPRKIFGKPAVRTNGGKSIDGMLETLSQYGYFDLDENGKADIRQFEDAFGAELRGEEVFSNQKDYADQFEQEPQPPDFDPENVPYGRLSRREVRMIYGPSHPVVEFLEKFKMLADDGLPPDIVADWFRFESGDEMMRTLAVANEPDAEVEARTDQRMLEEHGDLVTPAALERAAEKAIHNDLRARVLARELAGLRKATGAGQGNDGPSLLQLARQFAERKLAGLTVREAVKHGQHTAAETRAGTAAAEAFRKGDTAAAAQFKRDQMLNHELARAAMNARAEVEKTLKFFARVAGGNDADVALSRDLDIVNAARAILAAYDLGGKKAKRATEYLKSVEAYDPTFVSGALRDSVEAAEAGGKDYRKLTMEEFRALRDEVESLWHLSKRWRQMEVDGVRIDRERIVGELHNRMDEIGIPDRVPGEGSAITPAEQRLGLLKTFRAAARRVESWVGAKDGSQAVGPFRRYLWNPIKDAADNYRTDKVTYLKRFRALLDTIAPTMKRELIAAPELGYTFGKDEGGVGMSEILHAILHTGNESNKRKLLLGRKWAAERMDGSIDTTRWDAFIARLAREGKLTRAHFDFVQGVWDLLEAMKPLAQETHRDVFGRYFDEITAEPVATPFGTYRGGYVPAIADSRIVSDAKTRALMEEENQTLAFAFPATNRGFTKGRVEYNRPLMLDLRTIAQHIDKVLLFSHMERPVRDVRRVLTNSAIAEDLNRLDPEAFDNILTPWLNRASRQQVETPVPGANGLMRFFSVARSRAGMAAMFGNLANAAQQITGFSLAAVKVPPKYLLGAMAEYMKAPKKTTETVAGASKYMANRMQNEVAAMSDAINEILLNPTVYEQAKHWTAKHAYFVQSAVDNVMGPIIWTAEYNHQLEQGASELDARRLADSAVRETQGSTLPEDVSRIETGNAFVRMFTQFAGYFNMQANLLGTEFSKVAQELGLRKGAGRGFYILLFGFLIPAWTAEAIMQAFRGGPDDDDKDGEYLDDWLAAVFGWSTLRNLTAMVPGVGQAINAFANTWNAKPYDDRISTSPAISMIESAVKAPVSVYKAIADEGKDQKAVRDLATLISMTTGLPANLLARPAGYGAGVAAGDIRPTGPFDAVRGTVTGIASPESK